MRTIWEIITEECRAENPDAPIDDLVYQRRWIRIALKKYGEEIIQEIMEAEQQHNLYNGSCVNAVTSEWINKVKEKIQ